MRSKTKIVADGKKPPVWGFDGSSTNQATGDNSDCVLRARVLVPDPLRGPNDVLVMCEVLNTDMTPHATNTRARAVEVAKKYAAFEPMFGIEQEYTFFQDGRPSAGPKTATPRRRVRTTAASAAPRCPGATSSRRTRSPACARASASRARTPK